MTSLKTSDFNYNLPLDKIAKYPLENREDSKMLVVVRDLSNSLIHSQVKYLEDYLQTGDLLVRNITKVIFSRIYGEKVDTKGKAEIFITKKLDGENIYRALVRPSSRVKVDSIIKILNSDLKIQIVKKEEKAYRQIKFLTKKCVNFEMLENIGNIPIPPYLKREAKDIDRKRYQTVFAKVPGAVAAPTAGLHITENIIKRLKKKGIEIADILLHVGAGTFAPIKEDLKFHKMHSEYFEVNDETIDKIKIAKKYNKKVIAIGTTSTRAIESCYQDNNISAKSGWSELFIYPPYKFKMIDGMLTNFHLPKSTLICLVSALCGRKSILDIYKIALEKNYRFASYGDCMLILP